MFGAPAKEAGALEAGKPGGAKVEPAAEKKPELDENGRPTEDAMFGDAGAARPASSAVQNKEIAPEDPLKIGGQIYLRAIAVTSEEQPVEKWAFSVPMLVDGYFDARPTDRVRGFVLARLAYDPTIPESASSSPSNSPFATGKQIQVMLDQLWLRFDIAHTVFVTAGRQHVKWGSAHFWNPTDFLHQVRRNPLDPFDARTGTTMIKLQVPWEKLGWNLYGVGLFEDTVPDGTLGRVGGALRSEVVLGPAELGAEALFQSGHKPRLGADLSAGLGPIDVYAEASLRKGWETPLFRAVPNADPALGLEGAWEPYQPDWAGQATFGLNWSLNYQDVDVLTFGAEYFYNSVGYADKAVYPLLVAKNAYAPFYTGQHYLGVYGMFMGPASLHNLNLVLSNLANLSDRTGIARVDASVIVLTYLRIEAFVAFHYGHKGGEFRFTMDSPATETAPAFTVPTPLVEIGHGLRLNI